MCCMGNSHVIEPDEELVNEIQEAYEKVENRTSDHCRVQKWDAWAKFEIVSRSQTSYIRIKVGHPNADKATKDTDDGKHGPYFQLQLALNAVKYSLEPHSSGPHFELKNGVYETWVSEDKTMGYKNDP